MAISIRSTDSSLREAGVGTLFPAATHSFSALSLGRGHPWRRARFSSAAGRVPRNGARNYFCEVGARPDNAQCLSVSQRKPSASTSQAPTYSSESPKGGGKKFVVDWADGAHSALEEIDSGCALSLRNSLGFVQVVIDPKGLHRHG